MMFVMSGNWPTTHQCYVCHGFVSLADNRMRHNTATFDQRHAKTIFIRLIAVGWRGKFDSNHRRVMCVTSGDDTNRLSLVKNEFFINSLC